MGLDTLFDYCVTDGIDTEASYPYTGEMGPCKHKAATVGNIMWLNVLPCVVGLLFSRLPAFLRGIGARCGHVHQIPSGNETALTDVLASFGPVACGIDASQSSFQFYQSGIYSDPHCSQQVDHMIMNVGYGVQAGKSYYILKVKNSHLIKSKHHDAYFYSNFSPFFVSCSLPQNSWGAAWGMEVSYFILLFNCTCHIYDMCSYQFQLQGLHANGQRWWQHVWYFRLRFLAFDVTFKFLKATKSMLNAQKR